MKPLVTAAALITAALIMSVGLNLRQAGRLSTLAQQLADTEQQRDQARRDTKQLRVRQADLVRRLQAAEQTAAAVTPLADGSGRVRIAVEGELNGRAETFVVNM